MNLYKTKRQHIGNLEEEIKYVVAKNEEDAILQADTFLYKVLAIQFVKKIF